MRRVLATVIAVLIAALAYQTLGPSLDDGGVELSTSSVLTGAAPPRSAAAPAATPTPLPTTAALLVPSPTPTAPTPPAVVAERAGRTADPSRPAVAQSAPSAPAPADSPAAPGPPTTIPATAAAAAAAPQQQPAPASPAVTTAAPAVPVEPTPLPPTPVAIQPAARIEAAPPTSTPIPDPTPPPAGGAGLVYYVLGEINAMRANAGLAPLTLSPELSAIAADWSANMAATGQMTHRPGAQLGSMMPPGWRRWAENIATAPDIYTAQSALETSPGHHANMVDGGFTHIGIGISYGAYGSVWITQNFATY